jgi:hypothetical protein
LAAWLEPVRGLSLGAAGAEDDSGAVVEFDRGEQRAGEQGLAYLVLLGVLFAGPVRCGGHVVDDEQAMRIQGGDRAVESVPFAALSVSEDQVERADPGQQVQCVPVPQVDEPWPVALGGQGRGLRSFSTVVTVTSVLGSSAETIQAVPTPVPVPSSRTRARAGRCAARTASN